MPSGVPIGISIHTFLAEGDGSMEAAINPDT